MAQPPAVALAPGVWRIPTLGPHWVNSYALTDDDGAVTLVDCGLERAPARIVAGLAAIGRHPSDVTRIVLTHAHPDHAGGAAELARRTGARVAVHDGDAGYAAAGSPPRQDRSIAAGRLFARLASGRFPPVPVGERLRDGQLLPVGGGLRVVPTPGHSPGHVSLLHEPTRLLIAGDAIFNVRGMRYAPKMLCSDFRLSRRSAHELGELDYDRVAFAHGPEILDDARAAVRGFLARAPRPRA